MAVLIPLAHAAHWLWVLYIPPVLIVVISIVKTTLSERRAKRREGAGEGREEPNR